MVVVVVEWAGCWLTWRRGDVVSHGSRVLTRCSGGGKGRWWWKGMGVG